MTRVIFNAALRRLPPCLSSCRQPLTPTPSSPFQVQRFYPLRREQSLRRIHTTGPLHAPDRPTSLMNMLVSDVPPPVQVSSVSHAGIKLADGLVSIGPVIFLEGKVLLWDVPESGAGKGSRTRSWTGWTKTHWEVFDVVVPKPEILIFGTGARMELVPDSIRGYIKELGIQMDVMDTKNACSTYNLLAEEGRRVAAALLPIEPRGWTKKPGW